MPVSSEVSVNGPYFPNGVATDFGFDFKATAANEVVAVDENGTTISTALYSVTLDEDEGGTLSFAVAPQAGQYQKIFVVSDPALTQPSDFDNTGPSFNPAAVTRAFDRAGVRDLKQQRQIDRSLKVPFGERGIEVGSLAGANGMALGVVGGRIEPIENDIAGAEQIRVEVAEIADQVNSDQAAVAADKASTLVLRDEAADAAAAAGVARDLTIAAALVRGNYPVEARDHVPQGAVGHGAITGGSGGTDGTFALAFSSGNFDVNPTGTFTVAGGVVTAITLTGPGLYIGASPTAPTLSFAASAGLAGASATLTVGYLVGGGEYYYAPSLDTGYVSQFQNVANVATLVQEHFDPLSLGAAAAFASDAGASAAAAAQNVADLSVARTFGRPVTPITGLSASAATFVYANPFPVSATLTSIKVWGGSAGGTLTIRRWTKTGSAMAVIGSPITVTVVASVLNTFTISLAVNAGEYIGLSAPANTFVYTAASGDEGGHYSTTAGSTAFTAGAPSTGNRLQVQFGYSVLGLTVAEFDAAQASILSLEGQSVTNAQVAAAVSEISTATLGRSGTPVAGTNVGVGSYVLSTPATISGKITRILVYSQAAATLSLRVFDKSGDNFTVSGVSSDIAVTVGLNDLSSHNAEFIAKTVAAGQYVGLYNPLSGGFAYTVTGSDTTTWYSGGNGNFTDAAVSSGQRLEVTFVIERSDVTPVAARLDALESGGGSSGSRSGGVFSHELNFINNTGESLAAGNPSSTAITTTQEYDNVGFAAHATAPLALVPLTVSNTQLGTTGESPMYGALGHLKALIAAENGLAFGDMPYQLATCNNGYPGYTLAQISKGQPAFTDAMAQIQAIETIATAAGKTYTYQATILTTGVNDSAAPTSKANFKAALIQLVNDYATDAKAITGQHNSPILLMSQVSTSPIRDMSEAQMEVGQEHALARVVAPLYPFAWANSLHIDGPSTKLLGGYYGIALKRMLVDKLDFQPLMPVRSAMNGNVIDLYFNKRGLVLDTTLVPMQTNYGFSVFDGAGASQTISSVAIIAPDRVRITMVAPPAADWQVRYGYLSASGITNYSGGAGNLRDSQGDFLTYLGTPMHNWALLFRYRL